MENLKLIEAQNAPPDMSKWVFPLVNSQQKLDSMVGGRAQDTQKNKNKNNTHANEISLNLIQKMK